MADRNGSIFSRKPPFSANEKLSPQIANILLEEAGEFAKAVVKEFKGIEPVEGAITIGFEYGVENPQICGIEVIAE